MAGCHGAPCELGDQSQEEGDGLSTDPDRARVNECWLQRPWGACKQPANCVASFIREPLHCRAADDVEGGKEAVKLQGGAAQGCGAGLGLPDLPCSAGGRSKGWVRRRGRWGLPAPGSLLRRSRRWPLVPTESRAPAPRRAGTIGAARAASRVTFGERGERLPSSPKSCWKIQSKSHLPVLSLQKR